MQDPPPPVFPANPQMHPPRAAQPSDHIGESILGTNTGSAQETSPGSLMGMKAQADVPVNNQQATQDLQSEAMAMGSKTAFWSPERSHHGHGSKTAFVCTHAGANEPKAGC
jgi:hypothetical protein